MRGTSMVGNSFSKHRQPWSLSVASSPMHIDIITLFPEQVTHILGESIPQRAQNKGAFTLGVHNLRDYSEDKWGRVDDYPYGGAAGMVICTEPLANAIESLSRTHTYDDIIYMTPDGTTLTQPLANQLSMVNHLLIICGHYKGIDQRIRDTFVTREISIGDYVLSGGELAAGVLVDAIVRLLPGVLGDAESALSDSFQDGLLAPPLYTRPEVWRGLRVPEVLLSGHAAKIEQWKHEQSLARTQRIRPDLLK